MGEVVMDAGCDESENMEQRRGLKSVSLSHIFAAPVTLKC